MPVVSYVVTLYNKQPYLPYLIAGLAAQSGAFGREFVFIDDGSTDDTVAVLRQLTQGWPDTIIIQQKNAGPAPALNHGFALMRGDFVKPVDGDDILTPWATEALLQALQATGCDVAYTADAHRRYSLDQTPAQALASVDRIAANPVRETNTLRRVLHGTRTNPSMWLARSDLVRKVGGCDEAVFVQDYGIELRMAAASDFARIDAPVMVMPGVAPGRVSDDQAQLLHDANRLVVRFLRTHPDTPRHLGNYAMRRAAGRAWSWARRRGGKNHLSREFLLLAKSYCGLVKPDEDFEAAVCRPFRETSTLRIPAGA